MSEIVNIIDEEDDFPCDDWKEKDCPMKLKWREGDVICCGKCGWLIGYGEIDEENF